MYRDFAEINPMIKPISQVLLFLWFCSDSLHSSFHITHALVVLCQVLHPIADSININKKIWGMYFGSLLPKLVKDGSDGNCGSSAVCDTICLQVHLLLNKVNSHFLLK